MHPRPVLFNGPLLRCAATAGRTPYTALAHSVAALLSVSEPCAAGRLRSALQRARFVTRTLAAGVRPRARASPGIHKHVERCGSSTAMDPSVFAALEHCLAGNRSPGWAMRAHASSFAPLDAFETTANPVRRRGRRDSPRNGSRGSGAGGGKSSDTSLSAVEGLFGRCETHALTPLDASRISYQDDDASAPQSAFDDLFASPVQRQRPGSRSGSRGSSRGGSRGSNRGSNPSSGSASPSAHARRAQPASVRVSPDARPETPSMSAHLVSKEPLPADFLSQPWVQKYLHEIKGLLSIYTLEGLAVRWELERTDPELAVEKAKVRESRTPKAKEAKAKREKAKRRRAWREKQRAKEAAAEAEVQAKINAVRIAAKSAEDRAAAEAELARDAAETAAAEWATKKAAQDKADELIEMIIMVQRIQRVFRDRVHRKQHALLLQTPVACMSVLGGTQAQSPQRHLLKICVISWVLVDK